MNAIDRVVISTHFCVYLVLHEALKSLRSKNPKVIWWGIKSLWAYSAVAVKHPNTASKMAEDWFAIKWVEEKDVQV